MSRAYGEKGGWYERGGGEMDNQLMISRGARAMCGLHASGKEGV